MRESCTDFFLIAVTVHCGTVSITPTITVTMTQSINDVIVHPHYCTVTNIILSHTVSHSPYTVSHSPYTVSHSPYTVSDVISHGILRFSDTVFLLFLLGIFHFFTRLQDVPARLWTSTMRRTRETTQFIKQNKILIK